MRANAAALRLIAFTIGFLSIFLCCVGIGFVGIALAQDLYQQADQMDY